MQNYDLTLKGLLRRLLTGSVLSDWAGIRIAQWHHTELPLITSRRLDLLGEAIDGNLVHIELQSGNDPDMALRMAEYCLAIFRQFGRFPEQLVLYVGASAMRMPSALETNNISFRYRIADIREIHAERLLESERLEDNVLAILAGGMDQRQIAIRVLRRIAGSSGEERGRALSELILLAGLRVSAGVIIEEEAKSMPIVFDIMDHELFGPKIRQGREEGFRAGERELLLSMLARRFDPLPDWVRERLAAMSSSELEQAGVQLLSARTLDEVFS